MKFNNAMMLATLRRAALAVGLSLLIVSCGGGGGGGGDGDTPAFSDGSSTPTGDNVQPIAVDGGPAGIPNLVFTSVTVCEPGSAVCRTIDNIIVDTGSTGLRLVPAALGALALPQQLAPSGHPLFECVEFVDLSHAWGPVRRADIQIAGLKASAVPVQTIGDVGTHTEPVSCGGGDSTQNLATVAAMGGNGVLGVGYFREDCGVHCSYVPGNNYYFSCPASGCTPTQAHAAIQVQNPAALFPSDNNGVIIQLPAVPDTGTSSVNGWMIFGIDTRTNNALGSATIHSVDTVGYLATLYQGLSYEQSFVDSGSNGLFFPDSTMPVCSSSEGFFCPTATRHLSATLRGQNNNSSTVAFSVVNADALSGGFYALGGLAGLYSGGFDWGLPFFFGRRVYTGFETNPAGPYTAF